MSRTVLKEARKQHGLTQEALAARIFINLQYYKKIESGRMVGGIPTWDALEDFFGINQRKLREVAQ